MNDLRKLICFLTTVGVYLLLAKSFSASAQSEACGFLVSPQEFNTVESDGKIVIGQVRGQPYIVLSTSDLQENLPAIRTCIPDAFLTSSRLGSYIHVASFDNYRDARELAELVSDSLDIDIQIIHRNRLGR